MGRMAKAWEAFWRREQAPAREISSARQDWQRWNSKLHASMQFQAAYEAAIKRPDLWTLADFKDADASLLPEKRKIIRSHARYELMNNPVVARIMSVWVADVVGQLSPYYPSS